MKSVFPTLRWTASGLLIVGVLSRVLGLLREILIAHYFGISDNLDAVYLGISLPLAIAVSAGGGLSRAVVPIAAGLDTARFAGLCRRGTIKLLAWVVPLSVLFAATSPYWVRLLIQGEEAPPIRTLTISAAAAALMLPAAILAGFYFGLINSRGRHIIASSKLLLYNGMVCIALIAFNMPFGAIALLIGIFCAEYLQLAIPIPLLSKANKNQLPDDRSMDWSGIVALFWPSVLMGLAVGLNTVVDRSFATSLADGSVAALTYAEKLVTMPVSLLGAALAVPLFTRLSLFSARGEERAFQDTLLLGIRILFLAGAPAAVLLAGISEPLVTVILKRGAFTFEGVELTSTAMRGFAVGVPFQAMMMLLMSAGLARQKPMRIVGALFITTVINAVLDWILVPIAGLLGIAIATSIVATIRVFLLMAIIAPALLKRKSLWGSAALTCVFCAGLSLGLWFMNSKGLLDAKPGFLPNIESLLICAAMALLIVFASWPTLQYQRRTLSQLRNSVAAHAEMLKADEKGKDNE